MLFRLLALPFAALQLFNLGNLVAPWNPEAALAIADLPEPASHAWHAVVPAAVRLILTAGVLVALVREPADKPVLAQWLGVSSAIVLIVVAPFAGLPPVVFIVLPTLAVLAAYPRPRQLLSAPYARVNWLVAALTGAAAVALAPEIRQNIANQLAGAGRDHASEAHWALDAAYVMVLLTAAALASMSPRGWRVLAFLSGATFVYLGFAALATPSAGSWSLPGGVLALLVGLLLALAGLIGSASRTRGVNIMSLVRSPAPALGRITHEGRDLLRLVWGTSGFGFLGCSAAGLLFATVLSSAPYPSPFDPPFGPQTDVATYFAANGPRVQAMSFVFALAALCLLVFVACSAAMLADRAPERRSPLPGLALGAGTLAAGFWLLNALLLWALSQPTPAADPVLVATLHELTYLTGGPAHVLFFGVFIGAVSAALWGTAVLPHRVAWAGVAAAVAATLGVLALVWEPATFVLPVGRGLGMLWILATSIALVFSRSGEAMAAAEPGLEGRVPDGARGELAA